MVHYEDPVKAGSFCRLGLGYDGIENRRLWSVGVGEVRDLISDSGHLKVLWWLSHGASTAFVFPTPIGLLVRLQLFCLIRDHFEDVGRLAKVPLPEALVELASGRVPDTPGCLRTCNRIGGNPAL